MESDALKRMEPDPVAETLAEPGKAEKKATKPALLTSQAMLGRVLKEQYRIDSLLGQGAMGVVYRGTQLALAKPVAIKMLRPDGFHGDDALDRFQREATLVSKLIHPSIAQVLDFGIEESMPFLVMEFIDGKELSQVLEVEGPMPPSRAIAIIRQLASALEEAHKSGIVHRDIKPNNLRLMRYTPGGQIFLKVLDFGIAKQIGDDTVKGKLTATGAVMGTPSYMSPEQAGSQQIDARADQYATGIVLYELLTGIVPFTGETLTGVLMSHITRPPPALPREVPEPLRRVVMRLLQKRAADRFPDVTALDQALAACELACRDVPALPAGKVLPFVAGGINQSEGRKLPVLVIGGSAVFLSALALGGALLLGLKKRPPVSPPPIAPVVAVPAPNTQAAPKAPTEVPAPPAPPAPAPPALPPAPVVSPPSAHLAAPAHSAAKAAGEVKESPEVKEKLDDAEKQLGQKEYQQAIELARQTTYTSPTPRAYRLLVTAYCNMENLEGAKTAFRRTAEKDRRALIALCHKHDLILP